MSLAHDALNIVFKLHAGKLESFERDAMGRLLLAHWVGRKFQTRRLGVRRVYGEDYDPRQDECKGRQAIEHWRKLVPELLPPEMRNGPLFPLTRIIDIVTTIRAAIYDGLRASVFDRLGQAQRLVAAYNASITTRFPMGPIPTLEVKHNANFKNTYEIIPIRITLVRKLQRLAPELGNANWEATNENSGWILSQLVESLNGKAVFPDNQYAYSRGGTMSTTPNGTNTHHRIPRTNPHNRIPMRTSSH